MANKRVYDDPRWKDVRLVVLARDGNRCQIRGPKCKTKATHVDHIVSVSDGGARFDPANLRAACASCNIAKRNSEVAARAKQARTGVAPDPPVRRRRGMTRAEFLADTGFDWPAPPGGWPT